MATALVIPGWRHEPPPPQTLPIRRLKIYAYPLRNRCHYIDFITGRQGLGTGMCTITTLLNTLMVVVMMIVFY